MFGATFRRIIMSSQTSTLFLISFVLAAGVLHGATVYVPDDYGTIQGAIDAAANGDTVIVRPDSVHGGPYVENIDFLGKAIEVRSQLGPDVTTIDGNGTWQVVTFKSGEGTSTVLEGFTITNGFGYWLSEGGGIHCENSSPTISNNIITANTLDGDGGGIFCYESSPVISSNVISANVSIHG